MKNKENPGRHPVIDNLLKIMEDRGLTEKTIAEYAEVSPAKMKKILNGSEDMNVLQFSNIAKKLNMPERDIFNYPDIYEKVGKKKITIELEVTEEEFNEIELKKN